MSTIGNLTFAIGTSTTALNVIPADGEWSKLLISGITSTLAVFIPELFKYLKARKATRKLRKQNGAEPTTTAV